MSLEFSLRDESINANTNRRSLRKLPREWLQ